MQINWQHSAYRLKSIAEIFEELRISTDDVLVRGSDDDIQHAVTIVPKDFVERIIRCYQEGPGSSHQAAKETAAKISRIFYWPAMKRDIKIYIAGCTVCNKFLKLSRMPRAELHPMEVSGRGDCLAIDIFGGQGSLPVTSRGNKYILTIIDCFTRFAIAVPLPDQSAESVVHAVIGQYITVYGTPRSVLIDQGTNFESELFHYFCKLFRINKIRTSGYRPQSNGIIERLNQSLKGSLRKILSVFLFK